ncbi:MAG: impB/mucB/samB family protein [Candidatus Binataceae bacterium]|nr:impB/mucB/samB family protein [Candidatus Binataceae bacterium]
MAASNYPIPALSLRWLYVDFNSYFASVEQQMRPALRGQPVAVVPVETDSTCAIAASYEAKAFGVKTGTPIYDARRLCPGLICVLAQHERYVEFHHRLIEEIERHIPVTAVCSIDEVACRLMDNEISVERSTEIAQSIKSGIAKTIGPYMRCSIGIAPNRYLAKVGTELQKPDGLVVLRAEDLPQRLFILKLRDLPGVGANIERRIRTAGITDLPSLFALNPHKMRKVWGSVWGEKLWYLLRGMELPEEVTVRRSVGHSHVLAPELREPAQAKDVARRLTLKAASRLRRMEYYASAMSFSARLENDLRVHAEDRCYRAQDNKTFLDLLNGLWTQALKQSPGVRIRKVSVTLSDLVAATNLQADLFANRPDADLAARGKSENLSRAMDKINHRFGRDSVLIGMTPSQGHAFSGSKIAFTRIPDVEEFLE